MITAFFSCLFALTVLVAPLIAESERPSMSQVIPGPISDIIMEDVLTPWDPSPFLVNHSYADFYWDVRGDTMVTFESDPSQEHPLKCWLVRDDPSESHTADYLVFQQIYGWFGTKEKHTMISYREIIDAYSDTNNYSRITIDLRYTFDLFFWSTEWPGLPLDIYADEYNITAAAGMNASLDSLSPWGMVGKIMSFRLPGTPWFIQALIAVPIYMMLVYMAFVIIRSVIPLLPGG